MWQIVINGPGYFETLYDLPEGVTTLGRADENDIVLSGDLVSRRHARIHVQGETLQAEDLESRNGSRVNGEAFKLKVGLNVGDSLAVGENTLFVRKATAAESAKTEMVTSRLQPEGIVRFGQGVDIESAVIVAKNIKESMAYRLLDNVAPFQPTFGSDLPEPQERPSGSRISYESIVLLYQTAQRLAAAENLSDFLEETVDRLMARTNASTAVVLLRHPTAGLRAAVVRHRGKLARGEVPVSDAIIDAAIKQGAALAVADVQSDQRFSERESVILYGADQVLCVPLGDKAPFSGVLYLNKVGREREELDELLELCTAVGNLLASAVARFDIRHRGAEEGRLRMTLDRHLPPEALERKLSELADQSPPQLSRLEERQVTLLSVELVGASRRPASALGPLLGNFQQRVTGVVFSYEGALVYSLGDTALAAFGVTEGRGDDALRAVRAALAIRVDWKKLHPQKEDEPPLELRFALHTGRVAAGTVGRGQGVDYVVVGDPVGLVVRVRALAKPSQIVLTGKTLASVGARFDVAALGERKLDEATKLALFEVLEEDLGQSTAPGSPLPTDS